MSNRLKPTVYLVDVENKHTEFVNELCRVRTDDEVFLLASGQKSKLNFLAMDKVLLCPGKVYIDKAYVGTANALDFQLVSLLGYLVCCDLTKRYVIVTKDTGFIKVAEYWKKKGVAVHVCDEIGIETERIITARGVLKQKIKEVENIAEYTTANRRILVDEANTQKATYESLGLEPANKTRELNLTATETDEVEADFYEGDEEDEEIDEEDYEAVDDDYEDEEPEETVAEEKDFSMTSQELEDWIKSGTKEYKVAETTGEATAILEEALTMLKEVKPTAKSAKTKRRTVQKGEVLTTAAKKRLKAEKREQKKQAVDPLAKSMMESEIKDTELPEVADIDPTACLGVDIGIDTDDWLQGEGLRITGEVYEGGRTKVDYQEPEKWEYFIQKLNRASSKVEVAKYITHLDKFSQADGSDSKMILKNIRDFRASSPHKGYNGKGGSIFDTTSLKDLALLYYYGNTTEERRSLMNKYIHLFPTRVTDKKYALNYIRQITASTESYLTKK